MYGTKVGRQTNICMYRYPYVWSGMVSFCQILYGIVLYVLLYCIKLHVCKQDGWMHGCINPYTTTVCICIRSMLCECAYVSSCACFCA